MIHGELVQEVSELIENNGLQEVVEACAQYCSLRPVFLQIAHNMRGYGDSLTGNSSKECREILLRAINELKALRENRNA